MSEKTERALKAFGVTPWQLLLGIACIGSWWATVQPLPGQLAELNRTVQLLSTRVEVHAVLLTNVAEIKAEVKELRHEISKLHPKTASN
jgi:hypothetical protein